MVHCLDSSAWEPMGSSLGCGISCCLAKPAGDFQMEEIAVGKLLLQKDEECCTAMCWCYESFDRRLSQELRLRGSPPAQAAHAPGKLLGQRKVNISEFLIYFCKKQKVLRSEMDFLTAWFLLEEKHTFNRAPHLSGGSSEERCKGTDGGMFSRKEPLSGHSTHHEAQKLSPYAPRAMWNPLPLQGPSVAVTGPADEACSWSDKVNCPFLLHTKSWESLNIRSAYQKKVFHEPGENKSRLTLYWENFLTYPASRQSNLSFQPHISIPGN